MRRVNILTKPVKASVHAALASVLLALRRGNPPRAEADLLSVRNAFRGKLVNAAPGRHERLEHARSLSSRWPECETQPTQTPNVTAPSALREVNAFVFSDFPLQINGLGIESIGCKRMENSRFGSTEWDSFQMVFSEA